MWRQAFKFIAARSCTDVNSYSRTIVVISIDSVQSNDAVWYERRVPLYQQSIGTVVVD